MKTSHHLIVSSSNLQCFQHLSIPDFNCPEVLGIGEGLSTGSLLVRLSVFWFCTHDAVAWVIGSFCLITQPVSVVIRGVLFALLQLRK